VPIRPGIPLSPVVLVVDDEPLIRWALSEGLTESGCVVRVAASAAEARPLLASETIPAAVLLDLRLPDVDGLSFLREVRDAWPAAAVLMMTAHGSDEDASAARALGAREFIAKPFDVREVVRLVRDVCDRSGQH